MENFLGEIRLFAGNFAPAGWAFCDGSLVAISTNDALYSLIGTTYGGDGQNTFALPDLRGRVPMHKGTLQTPQGPVTYTLGEMNGSEEVVLTANQIPAHTHQLNFANIPGTTADPTNAVLALPKDTCLLFFEADPSITLDPRMIQTSGQSVPHANMQPYTAMNYIIATEGIYPPQS